MKLLALKLRAWLQIFRHFRNPLLVSAMRLGWLKPSLFAYHITAAGKRYVMLARLASIICPLIVKQTTYYEN